MNRIGFRSGGLVAVMSVACVCAAGDWLVDPSPYRASVKPRGDFLVMENGLVRRELLLKPGVCTWSFRNLMTGDEYVRAPAAEVSLRQGKKDIFIGGVDGMPILNYTSEQDRAGYRAAGTYRLTGWRDRAIVPRLEWKRRPEWSARNLPWPPPGRELQLAFASSDAAAPQVTVHYEIYDGAPIVAKWFSVSNTTGKAFAFTSYACEILRLAELHSSEDLDYREDPSDLFPISEFTYGDASAQHREMGFARVKDPSYRTQTDYRSDRLCTLEGRPQLPAGATLAPGASWTSHRIWEIAFDSSDRERRGLAVRRFWRLMAPWTDENPLIFHLTASNPDRVRAGFAQCVATGFETLLMSFGSGFNLESRDPKYRALYRSLADEGAQQGVAFGGYSLTASRSAGTKADNVQGCRPRYGVCPCLASRWGRDYLDGLAAFMREAHFGIFENDGPYPGDTCSATNHPYHTGYDDSFVAQWRAQSGLYRFCRANGIYVNQPDSYYLQGGSKNGMGYKEVNWSLPRARQVMIERQNVYDGTWTKTSSMGWMFVPLKQYHGGGGAATVEPLKQNLKHYDQRFADLLSAGVQACWRGPRLYDSPETLAMVRKWTTFYKQHRRILTGDFIHLRRADGRDWDGWMMCDAQAPGAEKAIASLFNPTPQAITRTITLPLHYAGLTRAARMRVGDGAARTIALDAQDRGTVTVTIPAAGYLHVFVQTADARDGR